MQADTWIATTGVTIWPTGDIAAGAAGCRQHRHWGEAGYAGQGSSHSCMGRRMAGGYRMQHPAAVESAQKRCTQPMHR